MNNEISNLGLLNKKLQDLKTFKQNLNLASFTESVSCNYHGINLHFKTKSSRFIESLKNLVPKDWISQISSDLVIYMMSPEEFGHTLQSWSEEVSQDCLSYENNTIAIQRDFASKIVNKEVLLICEECVGDGFYNFLRWYLSEKLMNIDKYVVHASSILDKEGKAHLFLGHSGAGKTTLTKLAHPRLVLGDDMNLVSFKNKALFVEAGAIGGQFNSMIAYDKRVPVKACYWLKQDDQNLAVALPPLISYQKFLASFANLHWPTLPQAKIEQLMKFSNEVVTKTVFYELNFRNDKSIWEYLDP